MDLGIILMNNPSKTILLVIQDLSGIINHTLTNSDVNRVCCTSRFMDEIWLYYTTLSIHAYSSYTYADVKKKKKMVR